MKNRFIIAIILILIVILTLIFEFIYIKNVSDRLSKELISANDLLSENDIDKANEIFEQFKNEYFGNERLISVFTHDSVIEDIHALVDEADGLFKTGETGEIGGILENLNGKIRDLYLSMLPNVRNLM